MRVIRGRARRIGVLMGSLIFADLATKLAVASIATGNSSGPLTPVRNHEFSLGIAGASPITTLIVAALGIIVAAGLIIRPALRGELSTWIPACVIGGALGNLIDRMAFGSVHDFLATPWAVINLADVAVLFGLAGLVSALFRRAARPAPST